MMLVSLISLIDVNPESTWLSNGLRSLESISASFELTMLCIQVAEKSLETPQCYEMQGLRIMQQPPVFSSSNPPYLLNTEKHVTKGRCSGSLRGHEGAISE